jgi:hypothetical protein
MDGEEKARAAERRARATLACDLYWACSNPSREKAFGGPHDVTLDELPTSFWTWTSMRAESADRFDRDSVARVRVRVIDQAKTTPWDSYEAGGEKFVVSNLFFRVMEPFPATLGELQFRKKHVDGSPPTVETVLISDGTLVKWKTHRHAREQIDFRVVTRCPIVQVSVFCRANERRDAAR